VLFDIIYKCVIADLLVTNFKKVWERGEGGWSKMDSKAFSRQLCCQPKAKIHASGLFERI
jgi:hypothetical protein